MKKLILAALLATSTLSLMAVRAKRTPFTVVQPDGTTIELRITGDERAHTTVTADGLPVVEDARGYMCYATVDAQGLTRSTAVIARNPEARSESERALVAGLRARRAATEVLKANAAASARFRANQSTGKGLFNELFPHSGDVHALVLLVEYSDIRFKVENPAEYYDRFLNQEGFNLDGGDGSCRDYFIASSAGQFRPTFDAYGPVTLSRERKYYGQNDSRGQDLRPEEMVAEACRLLDDKIDFSRYDTDGDGLVDNVYVIYAGIGEADNDRSTDPDYANSIWPHQYQLSANGKQLTLDGKLIDNYGCCNELMADKTPNGIGTFVHEFSHVLGLPDLYSYSEAAERVTPGDWSVMDYGPYLNNGHTPPSYSVFERNAMGWIEPEVLGEPAAVALENIHDTNRGAIVLTADADEFFLLENRKRTGWDRFLPADGMLIWHVEYNPSVWEDNAVNELIGHQYVDIEEASGETDNYDVDVMAGYVFPGAGGRYTSFTDDTKPSMRTRAGMGLNTPITDIALGSDGIVRFNVSGGPILIDAPQVLAPYVHSREAFTARWLPVDGAADYLLTVTVGRGGAMPETETADFGQAKKLSLPQGWSTDSREIYSGAGYYGQAAPSIKLAADGAYVMTRPYEADITSATFWTCMSGRPVENSLALEGRADTEADWTLLKTVTDIPAAGKGATLVADDIPAGIRQLRLRYIKVVTGANVAVDDFSVTTGGTSTGTLAGYEDRSTAGATEFNVTGVPADALECSYTVRAVDSEGNRSKPSAPATVDLSTGIEALTASCPTLRLEGRTLSVSAQAATQVTVTDPAGRTVATAVTGTDGHAVLTLQPGTAIVTAGPARAKFYVK